MNVCTVLENNNKAPPFSYILSDQENTSKINTVFGNVPVWAFLGYQLQDSKKKSTEFKFSRNINEILQEPLQLDPSAHFPDLPLVPNDCSLDLNSIPGTESVKAVMKKVTVTYAEAKVIHQLTVHQALSTEWVNTGSWDWLHPTWPCFDEKDGILWVIYEIFI